MKINQKIEVLKDSLVGTVYIIVPFATLGYNHHTLYSLFVYMSLPLDCEG